MYAMESNEIVWRCIPEDLSNAAISSINSASQAANSSVLGVPLSVDSSDGESWPAKFMSDVYTLRGYIFGFGFGVSVLVSNLYLVTSYTRSSFYYNLVNGTFYFAAFSCWNGAFEDYNAAVER